MSVTAVPDSLPAERQQAILQLLAASGRVLAVELAGRFAVSEDSIRRDLRELSRLGLCRRVYGGALSLETSAAAPALHERRDRQRERKAVLAEVAVGLLQAGQSLFLDAGSANGEIARRLPTALGLSVFTNAPDIAQCLLERGGVEVLLLGGRLDARSGAALGAMTVQQVRQLRADLCFPGTCAIDPQTGLWSVSSEEALLKRAMLEQSGETVVLALNEKFGAAGAYQMAALTAVDHLIVEHDAGAAAAACAAQGISLHRARAPLVSA